MLKKFSKFLLHSLLILIVSSSSFICLAHEDNEVTNDVTTSETTSTDGTTSTTEVHDGNLYLFDNDIVMDKSVVGNVFIFGNNVTVTGQIDGNLFVFADTLNLNECSVRYSLFACANSVYYNAACNDLHVASKSLDTTWYSYVVENAKIASSDVILRSAIGGNVDLLCDTLDLGEGLDIPEIYGNLCYSANSEITIPEGVLAGTNSTSDYTSNTITLLTFILLSVCTCIITVLVIYIITKKYTPDLSEKLFNQEFSVVTILKDFAIGLASIIVAMLLSIILMVTKVGIILALIFILLFAIICLIAVPTLAISITNSLKPVLKIEKDYMFYLILALVTVVLYGIPLIPSIFAGLLGVIISIILGLIINITAIGTLINSFLPHKELTEEEKTKIEEVKKLAKEDKEKRKQQKLEAKSAKKQAKLEEKDTNKKDK